MIYLITKRTDLSFNSEVTVVSEFTAMLEYFKDRVSIAVDSETSSLLPFDGKLLTLQLGNAVDQWVVDCLTMDVTEIKELLEGKLLLFHNAKFDLKWLMHYGIRPKQVYCSYVVELILTAGHEPEKGILGLKDLCKRYLDVEMTKDDRGLIHKEGLSLQVLRYCSRDVEFLHAIRGKQLSRIKEFGLGEVEKLENKFVTTLALVEYNGITLDKVHWRSVSTSASKNIEELTIKLDNCISEHPALQKFVPKYVQTNLFGFEERVIDINWNSPTQKLAILNALGLKLSSVEDKEIRKYALKHPIIALMLEFSKNQKLASTYGEEFLKNINKHSGKIHTDFKQILQTSRISSSHPNLLNIPRKGELGSTIRRAFIAKPDYQYVGGDYSGMELRILAELSQEPLWVDCFNRGGDLHSELCALTFKIPLADVHKPYVFNKDLTYRECQKMVDFAIAYGASEFTLSSRLSIPLPTAKKLLDDFFKVIPSVRKFLDLLASSGLEFGRIRTPAPYRRLRWFPEHAKLQTLDSNSKEAMLIRGSIGRESCNTPIQGCNGDIIKDAANELQDWIDLNDYPAEIKLFVYDELQCEVRKDKAEEFKLVLQEKMIAAAKKVIKSIPVVVDLKIADYWKK